MIGNSGFIRHNIRYYERLLTDGSATYPQDELVRLLGATKARLARLESEASNPTAQDDVQSDVVRAR